eukprot:TRINITY_DN6868_c0_g1_i1.p1 TRINITY_DN6868_c0_g1~~TRINITY_DN6868_c0_g1_i1.p1  ORF type:complete len:560 (+),score=-37.88 TRINITY_DN6868_c0_g1_i1:243-1682(+)
MPDATGWTPRMIAPRSNLPEMAALLLQLGANPNFQDLHGCTALHVAARAGNADMLIELLNHGGNPTIEDKEGRSPLLFISQHPVLSENTHLLPNVNRSDWYERMEWNHQQNKVYVSIPKTPREACRPLDDEFAKSVALAWSIFVDSYQDVSGAQVISKTLLRTQSNDFTNRQLQSIEHEFRAADKSGHGYLDRREFAALIMTLLCWRPVNLLVFQQAVDNLFDAVDINGNGNLELPEVMRLYGVMFQREHQEPSMFTRPESRYNSRPTSRQSPLTKSARKVYKEPSTSLMDNPLPPRDLSFAAAQMAIDPRGFLEHTHSSQATTYLLPASSPSHVVEVATSSTPVHTQVMMANSTVGQAGNASSFSGHSHASQHTDVSMISSADYAKMAAANLARLNEPHRRVSISLSLPDTGGPSRLPTSLLMIQNPVPAERASRMSGFSHHRRLESTGSWDDLPEAPSHEVAIAPIGKGGQMQHFSC